MLDDILENNLATMAEINHFAQNCGWYPISRCVNPSTYELELFFRPSATGHLLSDKFAGALLQRFGYCVRIYYQTKCVSVIIEL